MKYKAINIQHFLIAGMLLCACNVFAQKQSAFSAQFSFSSKTHFDKTAHQNNWFGAISVDSNVKLFFTPKKGRFSFSAGIGQTQWRSHLKYDDFVDFITNYDLGYQFYDEEYLSISYEDYDIYKIAIRYYPSYVNLSLGVRQNIVDNKWFEFHHGLELVNYFKQRDNVDIIYKKEIHQGGNIGGCLFDCSTERVKIKDHSTEEPFKDRYGNESSNRMIEANYIFGFMFKHKEKVKLGLSTTINKSLYVDESSVTSGYWGMGYEFNVLVNL